MTTERSRRAGVALAAMLSLLLSLSAAGCGGSGSSPSSSAPASGAPAGSADDVPDSDECALAVSALGSSSRRLAAIGFSGDDTAELLEQLTQFAATARHEAELLEGVTLDHLALDAVVRSYAKMTRDVAEAADAMAQSVGQQNALGPALSREPTAELQARMAQLERQQDAATEKLKRAIAQEAPLLERVDRLCFR